MSIFFMELRNMRKGTVISTFYIACAIFLMLSFFPAMQSESMQALAGVQLEGMDEAVLAAFGLSEMIDFTVITNYFGYIIQYVVLAIMVIVTNRAVSLFAKEESGGTIEFLYAKPVSRTDIVIQKLLAHTVLFAFTIIICMAVTIAGYLSFSSYNFTEAVREAAVAYLAIFFIGLIFSSVGLFLSTVIRSGERTAGIAIAIVFVTFIFGVMSAVTENLDFLIWCSPMDWIKIQKLMSEGILAEEWIVGAAVIIIGAAATLIRYNKKDLLIT